MRLLQGYLWHPGDPDNGAFADFDLENYLPHELGEAHLLWDKISAPFAFFENGEPTASQAFYQFTILQMYDARPAAEALNADALAASQALGPLLEATPDGVGWHNAFIGPFNSGKICGNCEGVDVTALRWIDLHVEGVRASPAL